MLKINLKRQSILYLIFMLIIFLNTLPTVQAKSEYELPNYYIITFNSENIYFNSSISLPTSKYHDSGIILDLAPLGQGAKIEFSLINQANSTSAVNVSWVTELSDDEGRRNLELINTSKVDIGSSLSNTNYEHYDKNIPTTEGPNRGFIVIELIDKNGTASVSYSGKILFVGNYSVNADIFFPVIAIFSMVSLKKFRDNKNSKK